MSKHAEKHGVKVEVHIGGKDKDAGKDAERFLREHWERPGCRGINGCEIAPAGQAAKVVGETPH